MSTSDTGKNAKVNGQEGTKKGKPPYKKATKDIQIKKSHKKGIEAKNAEKGKPDTLLGDLVANTTAGIAKAKEKGQKDQTGIDDIGVFEFIFQGLPEPPELECTMLLASFLVSHVVVPEVCTGFGGIVMRGCASRSLLGSYIHQK